MTPNPTPGPLPADPQRQAVNSWRGYRFQLLHTIHAWLDLPDDAVLYLEGAEDFDVVQPTGAIAVQVKHTSGTISLGSKSVLTAIGNYWGLRQATRTGRIFFRFLTRSAIAVERGQPFGAQVAGLSLWERCSVGTGDVRLLISFLRQQKGLPEDLRTFLNTAEPPTVTEELVRPIVWETGSAGSAFVEEAIERKLRLHGDKFGIPPSESARVLNRLLRVAFETICRSADRMLDRDAFLRIFEEDTRNTPSRQVQLLTTLAAHLMPVFSAIPASEPLPAFAPLTLMQPSIPPLPAQVHVRANIVGIFCQRLEEDRVLILTGSSGVGKTTLAKLIVQEADGEWRWLSLATQDPGEADAVLRQAGALLETDRQIDSVVLDGLDLDPGRIDSWEHSLGGLLYTVLRRRGRVVLSTRRSLPDRFLRQLAINPSSTITVPPFTEVDIATFATALGCPDADRASQWAAVIALHTKGHPQLVHAQLLHLIERKWPRMGTEDIVTTPPDVIREQAQARQLLSAAREADRELLYRLSVISGPFRRDHAVAIGESPPAVPYPGDVFDHLFGPWIESLGGDYYRLSPLLDAAAAQVWSPETVRSMNAVVAAAILRCRPLTTLEATSLLFLTLRGRAYGLMVVVMRAMIFSREEVWQILSRDLSWLVLAGADSPLIPDDKVAAFTLRLLQFRVAAELEPNRASAVAQLWEREIERFDPEQLYLHMRFMFAVTVVFHYKVPLPAKWLIARFVEAARLQEELHLDVPTPPSLPSWTYNETGTLDIISTLFTFVWLRCTGRQFFADLLEALAEVTPSIRARLLSTFKQEEFLASLLVDRVFLETAQSDQPDWGPCIGVLEQTVAQAKEWGIKSLAAAAGRLIAVIHDEYRQDPVSALATLDDVERQLEGASHLLRDARANIRYRGNDFSAALEIWRVLLPTWVPPSDSGDISSLFSYRKAAIAAAELGDWIMAEGLFADGATRSQYLGERGVSIGFLADAAYATWRAGNRTKSIDIFGQVLGMMQDLPDPQASLASFSLRKLVGHILHWIRDDSDKRSTDTIPPAAGLCSNLEHTEKLRELPLPPLDLSWALLLQTEYHVAIQPALFDSEHAHLAQSRLPVVRLLVARLDLRHSFRTLQFSRLVNQVRTLGIATADVAAHDRLGFMIWEEPKSALGPHDPQGTDLAIGISPFAAAIVALGASSQPITTVFADWQQSVIQLSESRVLLDETALAQELMSLEVRGASVVMQSGGESWERRLLASVRVALAEDTSPEELFISHTQLAVGLLQGLWAADVAPYLARSTRDQWLRRCDFPAALRSPRSAVPALRAACAGSPLDAAMVARILLAASAAVSVRIPADYVRVLRELWTGA